LGKDIKNAPVDATLKKAAPSEQVSIQAGGSLRLYAITIAIVGFSLYLNTIKNGYALDDFYAIPKNEFVMQGINGIPKLMTIDFWYLLNSKLGYYRPLSLITFAIENSFFGENTAVNHFDNALLYGLSGFMLFMFLMQLFPTRHPAFAFLISLVFMAHPIHTEVVANIKSRDEILSFLNTFITLYLVFKYGITKSRKTLIWSVVFFYLALLSKETAVTGLVLIPLFLFYSGLKIPVALKRSIPYAGISILFFLQKRYFLGPSAGISYDIDIINYPYAGSAVRLPSLFHIFWISVQKLIWPFPLSFDYSYNQIPASHWSDMGSIFGLVSFFALAFLCFRGILKRSIWSLGLAVFFVTIAPLLGFVLLRGGIFAERFLYAPCLGFAMILVYALSLIVDQKKDRLVKLFEWIKRNAIATSVILALCSFYSIATIQRNSAWKDNITLFGTDTKHSPNSAQAHYLYGTALIEAAAAEKDTTKKRSIDEKGLIELHKAIAIDSLFGQAYCQIGYSFQAVYKVNDSAIKYFKKAIETAPNYIISYVNLGAIYQNTGSGNLPRQKLASYYYNMALELDPNFPEAIQRAAAFKKLTGLDVHEMPEDVGYVGDNKPINSNASPRSQ